MKTPRKVRMFHITYAPVGGGQVETLCAEFYELNGLRVDLAELGLAVYDCVEII